MIFIDDLMPCLISEHWRWRESCHLFCDGNLDELHAFAARLGLKRVWFQDGGALPHYDLNATKRAQAYVLGANPIDRGTTVQWIRYWRQRKAELSGAPAPSPKIVNRKS